MNNETGFRQPGDSGHNGIGGLHASSVAGYCGENDSDFVLPPGRLIGSFPGGLGLKHRRNDNRVREGIKVCNIVSKWDVDQMGFTVESPNRCYDSSSPLRIIRSIQTWRVVDSIPGVSHCLERLAFQKGYRVAEVCRAIGCSSRYLHAVFVRDIGLSPKHWMSQERMVVARRKLEGGKDPEEVSRELGFTSMNPFYRQFMKFYQMSPGQFQSKLRIFDPTDFVEAERLSGLPRKVGRPRGSRTREVAN